MIKIFNTLTKKEEEFKPIHAGEVSFYHCGPTVYWTQHIGNIRAMVLADFIRKIFLYNNYSIKFVRNYTDVGHMVSDEDEGEDKMEKAAKREGATPEEIAKKYIDVFEKDCADLNILKPDFQPRATEYIKPIQDMVQILLEKDFAYITDLAIYFDISKAKDYNRLTGQKLEEKKEGAGKADVDDPNKKNQSDFALWFFKKGKHENALQTWDSSWGVGFPGWHIECSVMIKALLGDTIDIHMGGVEHVSIHHTNEIAQSESANGVPFVHYWLHNEHLVVDDKKMSKSEGTSYVVQDIINKGYDPIALRYFFLQAHYRSKQNFTWEALESAKRGLENIKEQVKNLGTESGVVDSKSKESFTEKINNDFNTPQALAVLQEVLKSDLSSPDKLATVLDFDKVFGLGLDNIEEEKIPQGIIQLAEERKTAKEQKDFAKSDQIRAKIEEAGYMVEDLSGGEFKIVKK